MNKYTTARIGDAFKDTSLRYYCYSFQDVLSEFDRAWIYIAKVICIRIQKA